MKAIGIAGQLGNGKDVLADYLVSQLNNIEGDVRWERSAFANAVKDVYCDTFARDRDFIEAWKRNPEPPPGFTKNVRQSLQFIGDGFRQIKDGIWIEIALRDETLQLVFSDSRYINEAKAIKAKNGLMIVLYRPGFLNDDPNPSESQIKPIIEWCANNLKEGPILKDEDTPEMLNPYDYFFVNEGTIEDMYKKVDTQLIPWLLTRMK
jgi:hypothetical protein